MEPCLSCHIETVVRSAALLPAAKVLRGREALTASNLGVQLYTVRSMIGADPAAVLKAIQDIGYREAEATYGNLNEIWPALKETQLKPVSVHLDTALFFEGGSKLDSAIADVKQRGFVGARRRASILKSNQASKWPLRKTWNAWMGPRKRRTRMLFRAVRLRLAELYGRDG